MEHNDTTLRQSMAFGWIPAAAHVDVPWQPDDRDAFDEEDGSALTICAGYTTTLPDVIDIASNFHHWENGALDHVCPSGVPAPMLVGLNLFKNAGESRSAFRMAEANREREERNRGR